MSTLVNKIKNNKEATAYKYFEAEVEIDEAEALATALELTGDMATAATIRGFIAQYNGDEIEVEVEAPKAKAPKAKAPRLSEAQLAAMKLLGIATGQEMVLGAKAPKAGKSEYYQKGRVNLLDVHLDEVFDAYDPALHLNNRFRVKPEATQQQKAMYLNKFWHEAIEFYAADDTHGRFTRLLRHQISSLTEINSTERKKALKGIPTEKEVNDQYEA